MGAIQIKKVLLKDLRSYSQSDEFKGFKHLPISPFRVESYIHNPRKNDKQYVLYLALKDSELVGYRTIFQDHLFVNDKAEPFGWFSGNWVDPNQRRQGISTLLFNEVVKDWKGRLIASNLAPAAELLFENSQQMSSLIVKKGIRIYFQFQIYQLLAHRFGVVRRLKYLVLGFETIVNAMLKPHQVLKKKQYDKYLNAVEITTEFSDEIASYINQNSCSSFGRQNREYQWISNYPWVKENSEQIPYEFSYTAKSIKCSFLVSRNNEKRIDGLAMLKHVNGNMKISYFVNHNSNSKLSKAVLGWAYQNNVKLLTCFNTDFLNGIKSILNIGVFKKQMIQKYFIMNSFKESLSYNDEELKVQDGDGDVIFT